MMKRLRRAIIQAIFSLCLISLPLAFSLPAGAQQTSNLTEQDAIQRPVADSIIVPVTVTDKRVITSTAWTKTLSLFTRIKFHRR